MFSPYFSMMMMSPYIFQLANLDSYLFWPTFLVNFPAAQRNIVGRCTALDGCHCTLLIIIWLVVDPPLWKIWVRQLGWWHSQYMESMFQTTNQLIIIILYPGLTLRTTFGSAHQYCCVKIIFKSTIHRFPVYHHSAWFTTITFTYHHHIPIIPLLPLNIHYITILFGEFPSFAGVQDH